MPIYEYRCTDCGNDFEYQQRMSDAPKSVCESCGGALEKLISRSSFHFKGGGWYKDLYASSKKDSGSSGDSSTKSSDKPSTPSAKSSESSTSSTPSASSSAGSASSSTSSGSASGG